MKHISFYLRNYDIPKKIITGEIDGELIWRYQTAEERLQEQLQHI